ncbi:MAG: hypothetical protein ACRD4I_15535 [Candidatus Angelobacter sp.]
MKISVHKQSGLVVVNDKAKPVDLSTLAAGIDVAFFNTETERGFLQYDETQMIQKNVRDLDGERRVNAQRLANNQGPLEKPMFHSVAVRRPGTEIDYFVIEPFYNAWLAAEEPPPPEIPPEAKQALDAQDEALSTTFGDVTPKTRAEIMAMTRVEYRSWFLDNFNTAQDLRLLLARIFRYIISR